MRNEPSNHPILPLSTRMVFLHFSLGAHGRPGAHPRRPQEQASLSLAGWGFLLLVPLFAAAILLGSLYA